jgi:hypothetical protein
VATPRHREVEAHYNGLEQSMMSEVRRRHEREVRKLEERLEADVAEIKKRTRDAVGVELDRSAGER